MDVCCDYPDQIRPIIDELVSYLNDNQLDEIEDLIVNNYGEEVAPSKVTNKDDNKMVEYHWDPDFYNEIVKDWNYRFPKFSYIEYPEFKKGI